MALRIYETLMAQRTVLAWALIVGLLLVLVGHAPVFPVATGCVLAITVSVLRSRSRVKPRPVLLRGGR
jgi:hypothetical protein